MSSLIAHRVKTNACFASVNLFIVLIAFMPLFTLNCTAIIVIITACPTQLFAILLTIATVLFTRNFTQGWLNSYCVLIAIFVPFICTRLQSAERSQSRMFIMSPSREIYRVSFCICFLILVCPACLLLLVCLKGVCVLYKH